MKPSSPHFLRKWHWRQCLVPLGFALAGLPGTGAGAPLSPRALPEAGVSAQSLQIGSWENGENIATSSIDQLTQEALSTAAARDKTKAAGKMTAQAKTAQKKALNAQARNTSAAAQDRLAVASQDPALAGMAPGRHIIHLPDRIPAQCVANAAQRYQVPEMAILAILRQESGGHTGVINKNTDGSLDYGPAQFNSRSWAPYMQRHYGISISSLTHDMCQAIMAQAYAIRAEWNRCIRRGQNSIWCAAANYHSPTPSKQAIYIADVWRQYLRIISTGQF